MGREIDETRVEKGETGERNDDGIFDFFCCRTRARARARARRSGGGKGASFHARGFPVDGTINDRDIRLFWIGNFEISSCLCASSERRRCSSELRASALRINDVREQLLFVRYLNVVYLVVCST